MIKLFGKSQILTKDETLEVVRQTVINYKDGKKVLGQVVKLNLIANVQPLNGRDLLLVPEHDRFNEQYWLYFDNRQWIHNKGLEFDGPSYVIVNDRVIRPQQNLNATITPVNYQVQTVENWGSFSQARIMRIDTGPEATP